MSFSLDGRALRNSRTYSPSLQPELSMNIENSIDASKACGGDKIYGATNGVSPVLLEESFRANSEPLNAQFSALTQLLNQLIQDNWTKTTPTACPQTPSP